MWDGETDGWGRDWCTPRVLECLDWGRWQRRCFWNRQFWQRLHQWPEGDSVFDKGFLSIPSVLITGPNSSDLSLGLWVAGSYWNRPYWGSHLSGFLINFLSHRFNRKQTPPERCLTCCQAGWAQCSHFKYSLEERVDAFHLLRFAQW